MTVMAGRAAILGARVLAAALCVLGALFGISAAHAQTYPEDFSLHMDNGDASGIWADADTVWVLDSADNHIYAYARRTGTRLSNTSCAAQGTGKEICIGAAQQTGTPQALWSDGANMWVLIDKTSGADEAHIYRLSDSSYVTTVALDSIISAPRGMCSTGDAGLTSLGLPPAYGDVFIADADDAALYVYAVDGTTLTRKPAQDLTGLDTVLGAADISGCVTSYPFPQGWVADEADGAIYGITLHGWSPDISAANPGANIASAMVGGAPAAIWGSNDEDLMLSVSKATDSVRGFRIFNQERYQTLPVATVRLAPGQSTTVVESAGTLSFVVEFNPAHPGVFDAGSAFYNVGGSQPAPGANFGDYLLAATRKQERITSVDPFTSRTVTVNIDDDMEPENPGWVSVTLARAGGYHIGSPGAVSVTVTSDDAGVIPPPPGVMVEGGIFTHRPTASEAPDSDLMFSYTFRQIGNVSDDLAPRMVTIPQGQTAGNTISVRTVDDNTDEEDGAIIYSPSMVPPPFSPSVRSTVTVTVLDNDDPPVVSVDAAGGSAGDAAVFTVRLRPAEGAINGNVSDSTITVDYIAAAADDDTGVPGTDFEAVSGTVTFAPSDTEAGNTRQVSVPLPEREDNQVEETFTFTLSNPDAVNPKLGANLAGGAATLAVRGTVMESTTLSITADAASVAESAGAAEFTIRLSRAPDDGGAVEVPVTVSESGNMLAGAAPASATIPAGETAVALSLPLAGDNRDEADSIITAMISVPEGREDDFTLGAAAAMVTVTDDDEPPQISVAAAEAVPEGRALMFPVQLSAASERPITAMYSTEAGGGTATAGDDYEAAMGAVSFAPGQTADAVAVQTHADGVTDPGETVVLTLSAPVNAILGAAQAEGVIREGLNAEEIAALNEAILPHVIAALNEETTGAIRDRVQAVFNGDEPAAALSIRGGAPGQFIESLLPDEVNVFRDSREGWNPERWARMLDSRLRANDYGIDWTLPQFSAADFNFDASLNAGGAGGFALPPIHVWGRGYYRDLSVENDPISFEGDILGFILGADARFTDAFLAGISLNHTRADIDWDNSKFTGAHETALTSIHPYAAWQLDSGLLVWSSLGYGEGDLELTEDGNAAFSFEHDVSVGTAAIGGYGPLPSAGPVDFGIIADAAYARTDGDSGTPAVESGWLRAGVEADYDYGLPDGSALSVKGELALRSDFGDAKSGGGVELGSQLEYRLPLGLRFDLKGRALLAHEDDEVEEWGISGGIAYTTPGIGGLAIAFSPEWGITNSARERILNGGFAHHRHSRGSYLQAQGNPVGAALRYNLEMRYGILIFRNRELLTFSASSSFQDDARADLRFEHRF